MKPKSLRPIRPNAGIEADYAKRLQALIDAMHKSCLYWICAAWRKNEPNTVAQDVTPVATLQRIIRALTRRWQRNFNEGAKELAKYFAQDIEHRSSAALKHILKQAGFTVRFTMTPEMRDILNATVQANVGLIRTIPQQYLGKVQDAVMRSVQQGRDLKQLTDDIGKLHQVTRRRAAFIAVDQNNKATSAMVGARQRALGIEEGIWMHSHAGKQPRPTHVANDGKRFSIKTGWYDPHEKKWIMPGQLIRCRCTWRPVIPGLSVS